MRLSVVTPLQLVVDEEGVRSLRAEDASGGFGVQPGHAALVTSLVVSVLSWTGADGARRHCAVRRGVLTVRDDRVLVATREAVTGDDLGTLDRDVLARFHADADVERVHRVEGTRLQLAAIRRIVRHLRPRGALEP